MFHLELTFNSICKILILSKIDYLGTCDQTVADSSVYTQSITANSFILKLLDPKLSNYLL